MKNAISQIGATLGNWNDKRFGQADARSERPRIWHVLDRFCSLLYTLPDRPF